MAAPINPAISIIGLHGKEELHIVKGILGEILPAEESTEYWIKYKWVIDNKYYKAETCLCRLKNNDCHIYSSMFDFSEAVIIYIDSSQAHALNDVNGILHHFENHPIDVKLLVCDGFKNGTVNLSKAEAQDWCIKNGWELVELVIEDAESEHEEDLEDDFIDSWGFTRIKQALNAHTWSNLQLKDKEDGTTIGHLFKQLALNDNKSTSEVPYEEFDENLVETEFNDSSYAHGAGDDDFSALFSSLGEMKEKAESLPLNERRIYAEKIAMAFLRSFGDDEGLSDGDSDEGQT